MLAFATIGLWSGAALARCEPQIRDEIARLGAAERVAEIGSVTPRRFGGGGANEGEVADYTAWIRLSDCSGHLVVRLTPTCRARSAYTTRDCHVDGVSRSWLPW